MNKFFTKSRNLVDQGDLIYLNLFFIESNILSFQLVGYLNSQENKEFVEVVNFSKKYYLGCLASIGFGFNVDCFSEQESEFEKHAKYSHIGNEE